MSNLDYNMAHGLAKAYIEQHYYTHLNGHREQLIKAVANDLKLKGYPYDVGVKVAIKEIAAFEGSLCRAELDIDRSNSSLVVVYDRQHKRRLYFTVQDLINTANTLTVRTVTQ
ncbi:MAG: hypothetical protein IPP76_01115 [Moraxellaceae bacterium]|nr:hypothetical protein [Moraxellaceae bacterium]